MRRSIHSAGSLRMPTSDYWFGFKAWNRDDSTLLPGMGSRFEFTHDDTRIWVVRTTNTTHWAQPMYAGMVGQQINPGASGIIIFAGHVSVLKMSTNNTIPGYWLRPDFATFTPQVGKHTVELTNSFIGRGIGFALSEAATNTDMIDAFLTMRRK